MKIRNVRPWAVELAATLHDRFDDVASDEVIDVPDDLGFSLLEQPDNWQPGDDETQAALDAHTAASEAEAGHGEPGPAEAATGDVTVPTSDPADPAEGQE